jgi:four helix bundle protein
LSIAECRLKKGKNMTPDYLKNRTKQFGLAVIRLVESLPKSMMAGVIGKQVLRSATSVGANYRAVCRARSKADFVAKLGIVEEEIDESGYWLELLIEANIIRQSAVTRLLAVVKPDSYFLALNRKSTTGNRQLPWVWHLLYRNNFYLSACGRNATSI